MSSLPYEGCRRWSVASSIWLTQWARIRTAQRRVERLERELEDARRDYLKTIEQAHESGMTLAAIAVELGISRQRVAQLIDKSYRPE